MAGGHQRGAGSNEGRGGGTMSDDENIRPWESTYKAVEEWKEQNRQHEQLCEWFDEYIIGIPLFSMCTAWNFLWKDAIILLLNDEKEVPAVALKLSTRRARRMAELLTQMADNMEAPQ
jgi:hypothetical protein